MNPPVECVDISCNQVLYNYYGIFCLQDHSLQYMVVTLVMYMMYWLCWAVELLITCK